MSELAFDSSGEPFELPATAAFWRVRRFRNAGSRGGPEVVFGREGSPLILPIETGLAEFRDQVAGAPGRYRLDPLDERQRPVSDVPAAYLQMAEAPRTSPVEEQSGVIRELARANADMAKTIADKFAAVMQSAAELLRAADGAGLPGRLPPEPPRNAAPDDDDEDNGGEESGSNLVEIVKHVMPLVQLAVGQVLGRKATAKTLTEVPPAQATRNVRKPECQVPAEQVVLVEPDETGVEPDDNDDELTVPHQAVDPVAHMQAIESELSAEEVATVRAAIGKMTPEEMQSWCARLCTMPAGEAALAVRDEMTRSDGGAR